MNLDKIFHPEGGVSRFLQNVGLFSQTKHCQVPEDGKLLIHRLQNLLHQDSLVGMQLGHLDDMRRVIAEHCNLNKCVGRCESN